jgi:ryanodine receptor 3
VLSVPPVYPPQCYLFHLYAGVRAGGGIGDELEDPAGDPYELWRILFDITFFFFVIVILLAIIQGTLLPGLWLFPVNLGSTLVFQFSSIGGILNCNYNVLPI